MTITSRTSSPPLVLSFTAPPLRARPPGSRRRAGGPQGRGNRPGKRSLRTRHSLARVPECRMPSTRCAVHPSRPAASRCPRCDRLRCDADAAALPEACLACTTVDRHPPPPGALPAASPEAAVRAGAAAVAVAAVAALICSQYVDAGVYAYVTPALAGVVCGAAVHRAAGSSARGFRVLAVVAALVAVAGSF